MTRGSWHTRAFAPAYIGGWSAAEHWGLTEQLFRSTFVVTAGSVRTTTSTLLGAEFRLVRVPPERVASVPSAWRGAVKVNGGEPRQHRPSAGGP